MSRRDPTLGHRSKSLPIINALNHQRFQVHLKHVPNPERAHRMRSKILQLDEISNKQDQELHSKLKHLQERSHKKLQERYECIDKWKKKYIPQYPGILKHKLSLDSSRNSIELIRNSPQQQTRSARDGGKLILPSVAHIVPPPVTTTDQGKRLERVLMEKLEKHRKLIDVRSHLTQKEINYFEEFYSVIPPEKKRELELKKFMVKADRQKALNQRGLFHKKANLEDPRSRKQQREVREQYSRQQQIKKVVEREEKKKEKRREKEEEAEIMEKYEALAPEGWETNQGEEQGEILV